MVCIWDLGCVFQTVPTTNDSSSAIHPIIDIAAQLSPCTSITWCPLDTNYICTGTHTHTPVTMTMIVTMVMICSYHGDDQLYTPCYYDNGSYRGDDL